MDTYMRNPVCSWQRADKDPMDAVVRIARGRPCFVIADGTNGNDRWERNHDEKLGRDKGGSGGQNDVMTAFASDGYPQREGGGEQRDGLGASRGTGMHPHRTKLPRPTYVVAIERTVVLLLGAACIFVRVSAC
ncbi:hypothetical protein L249_6902, partial [Ophiocordyceps polyrhachis-furcata BCC 54312]